MENESQQENEKIDRIIRKKTILSFSVFGAGIILAWLGWKWLMNQPEDNGALKPLRSVLAANAKANSIFFSEKHLATEYPKSKAVKEARVNGDIGMGENFDPDAWQLFINRRTKINTPDSLLKLTMTELKLLPKRDVIFEFHCIEGWSEITHWGGIRFSDFLTKYKLGTHSGKAPDPLHPEDLYKYVGLMTPDSAYYVGIDMKSMMHPQTILCFELNDKPLPMDQGYPLRLIITVKYGIKSLKRIGYIYFSDTPPPDYWFEKGYDYDAAL